MRQDAAAFAVANLAPAKYPRLVVRIEFDVATIYVTSDEDMVNVPGTPLLGFLQDVTAVSQEINPDDGRSTIGSLSFSLVDIESEFTDAIRDQLQTELQNIRGRTVQLRLGFGTDYNDTKVVFTQQVRSNSYDNAVYHIGCNDIQREMRKEIFEPLVTTLRLSVGADDDVIPVQDTTGFQLVFHGPSYSDAPGSSSGGGHAPPGHSPPGHAPPGHTPGGADSGTLVVYFRLEDEIIRATGITADSFTGCTRGVFNTNAVAHVVEAGADDDRQPEVTEFIYLELPGPKLAYAILTGELFGDTATLPPHWHMGIPTSWIHEAGFTDIGEDLWNLADDNATLVLRFAGQDKIDGKQFLEQQVYQPLGVYAPIRADGTVSLRRMNHILADAPYVMVLDENSFIQVGALEHDFSSLLNVFSIDWNYDPIAERRTRRRRIIDQASIDVHGEADVKNFEWDGLHGSRHTDAVLLRRSDSIRDRYAGPPLRLTGELLHSYNVLEPGDVVRVQLEHVRDYTGAVGPIDRSFEIQRMAIDHVTGRVSVSLFGSSQRSSVLPPDSGTALPDAWYSSQGVALSTVCTIVADVIQPGTYDLTGSALLNDSAAIYYHLGDLTLADGATLTVNDNVQLRIRGFFTVNGDIVGVGRGQAGAVDDGVFANDNPGSPGYIGATRGWEGLNHLITIANLELMRRWPAPFTDGLNTAFPLLELSVIGGALVGLPVDIRGTSGGAGGRVVQAGSSSVLADGGDGGDGGAGVALICRGASLGASGSIDLSGGDSALGESVVVGDDTFRAGSGAPGGPGGMICVIDGSAPSLPDLLAGLIGAYGAIPSAGNQPVVEAGDGLIGWSGLPDPLAGYNTSIGGDITASILRIQRLAVEQSPTEDVVVTAPANFAVVSASYGAHVLSNTPPPSGSITEYFASITNDRTDAVLIGSSTVGRFVHIPDEGIDVYYWARNRNMTTLMVSLFTPNTTTTTVVGDPISFTGDGKSVYVASIYKRAASPPSTPAADDGSYNFGTGVLTPPSGWSVSPPSSDGNPLYVSTGAFEIVGLTGTDETVTWTAPALLVSDGVDGEDGEAAAAGNSSIVVQVYKRAASPPSTPAVDDGSYNFTTGTLTPPSGWSASPPASDGDPLYVSVGIFEINGVTGTDETVTWTAPAVLVSDGVDGSDGEDGAPGADGTLKEFVFRRSPAQPATPTGNGVPASWFDDPPAGADPLWLSTAEQELDGTTIGVWSEPIRLDASSGSSAMNVGRRTNSLSEWYSDFDQNNPLSADANFSIVEPGDAPIGTTAIQALGSVNDDFFSERMTIDVSKKHRVSVWAEQPTGDRTAYLLVAFYDAAGDLINSSSSPASDATGWGSIGSQHYWEIVNDPFTTDWSLYEFEFGGDAAATIPTGAVSFAIGALTTRSTPGTTETTQRFNDYRVVELADDGVSGLSVYHATIYRRSASPPSTPTGGSYNFTTATLTPPASWFATPPASDGNPLYASVAEFAIVGQDGTDSSTTWTAPAILLSDGVDGDPGADGSSSIVAQVYKRSASPPSTPAADDGSYNFTTATLTPPSTWSATPPASDGNPLYVSVGIFEIAGTTGTDETVVWTAPALLVSDGTDGDDGADGDDAVVDDPVLHEPADDEIDYTSGTQPRVESAGLNGYVTYTPSVPAQVQVSFSAQAQISNTTSGGAVGYARILLRVFIDSSLVWSRELKLEGCTTGNEIWGLLAGSKTFSVPSGDAIEAYLDVGRSFSTSGSSPAQTIYWQGATLELLPFNAPP